MINPDDLLFGSLFFVQRYSSRPSRSIHNIIEVAPPPVRRPHRGRPREVYRGALDDIAEGSLLRPDDDLGSVLETERASPISHMALVGAL